VADHDDTESQGGGAQQERAPSPIPSAPPDSRGLVRDRLMVRLVDTDSYRVGWIVAPAGSGKSRLLSHLVKAFPGPVAWCGAPDPAPRSAQAFLAWIWDCLSPALQTDDAPRPPKTVEELLARVSEPGPAVLLAVDDVHLIEGLESETALSELVSHTPLRLRVVMTSRVNLHLDLSRLRVSGQLVEMGPDDLRFRTWEVEELFRDVYGDPLLPEDVAALAQRTSGWAAYLQLFFLATARKPQAERRRLLGSLTARNRLVSEYLGRHALAELSPELQEFLVRTSVLRRPSPSICDEFLGYYARSAEMLAELERRQLFTEHLDDDAYRYHSVLLSYLDSKLVETIGAVEARSEHSRAGAILEREGWSEDALAAYTKAEDWETVARLVGHNRSAADSMGDAWLDALPAALVESDPLLLIVRSHRALARGDLAEALQALRDAESVASSQMVAARCRAERDRLLPWTEPDRRSADDWTGLIRQATRRHPLAAQAAAARLDGVAARFAEGCAAFLAGDMLTARRVLRTVSNHPDAAPPLSAGAALVAAAAGYISGRPLPPSEADRVLEEIDASNVPWLERLGRAALLGRPVPAQASLDSLAEACEREGDRWGSGLVATLSGIRRLFSSRPEAIWALERAARIFGDLGAGSVEALCLAYAAVAALRSGSRERASRLAAQARTVSALHEVPGATAVAALVHGALSGDDRELERAREILAPLGTWEWHSTLVDPGVDASASRPATATGSAGSGSAPAATASTAGDSPAQVPEVSLRPVPAPGIPVSGEPVSGEPASGEPASGEPAPREPVAGEWISHEPVPGVSQPAADSGGVAARPSAVAPAPPAGASLRCLGGYTLSFGGTKVAEDSAKPMERALLHLLSLRVGEAVHREILIETLWPDADPDAGLHRLQVAVSSLRRLLAGAGVDGQEVLARDRESYRLSLPADADIDFRRLEQAARAASVARRADEDAAEEQALVEVMALYAGPLLADDGPAEWATQPRRVIQNVYAEAATRRAVLRLKAGDLVSAVEVARAGLAVDRYRDELWKLLVSAAEQAGNHAEAEQARRGYDAVLSELGV
jgi:DNA-binding SARP family transcriptional activator